MAKRYDVAAYVWPSYTGDEPRTKIFWPEGMGEWQTVRDARAKRPEQQWPRRPLWGYVNEADPRVMELQIGAAADHGVNVFIYDWYWYDGRPFLEQCLNNGFLKARNNDRMKYYLMWANHDVNHLWDKRNADRLHEAVIWRGGVDRREFERVGKRLIEMYFTHPLYYTIDGKPVFMIYDLANLLVPLGGIQGVREAFDWLRGEAVRAGLPGLHLQMTYWSAGQMKRWAEVAGVTLSEDQMMQQLGYDSLSHYQFVHFADIDRDYGEIVADVVLEWERLGRAFEVPYFPHVSVGWDANPRFTEFVRGVVRNNTPEQVEQAFRKAKAYVDGHAGQAPLVTINSWNEWTETSYLQPDDAHGYGYLEAVKKVFCEGA